MTLGVLNQSLTAQPTQDVVVTNASTTLLAANPNRRCFIVRNNSGHTLTLGFGETATTSLPVVIANGGSYIDTTQCGDAINGILDTASGHVFVQEFTV